MKELIEAVIGVLNEAKDPEITKAVGVYHPVAQTKMLFKGEPLFKKLKSIGTRIGKDIIKNAGHGDADKVEGGWIESLVYSKKTGKFLLTGYTRGSQVEDDSGKGRVWKDTNNSVFAYMLDLDAITVKKIQHDMFKPNSKGVRIEDEAKNLAEAICKKNSDFEAGDHNKYGMLMKKKVSLL